MSERPASGGRVSGFLEKLHANKDVFRQPANEEDQDHHENHAQGFLTAKAQASVLVGADQHPDNQRIAEADDGERDDKAHRDFQPLDFRHVREAEVYLPRVLQMDGREGHQGRRDGAQPDEAAAEPGVLHGAEEVGLHDFGQGDVPVEAHPGEEEDAAVHVDLQEQGHEGAEDGDVVVFLIQVKHFDEGVHHQDEVGRCQVNEVEVGDGHLLAKADVHHQDQDVPHEADGEEEYRVKAGQEKAYHVLLLLRFVGKGESLSLVAKTGPVEFKVGAVTKRRRGGSRVNFRGVILCEIDEPGFLRQAVQLGRGSKETGRDHDCSRRGLNQLGCSELLGEH